MTLFFYLGEFMNTKRNKKLTVASKVKGGVMALALSLGMTMGLQSASAAPFGLSTSEFTCVLSSATLVIGGIIELAGNGTAGAAISSANANAVNESVVKDQLQTEASAYYASNGTIDVSPTLAHAIEAVRADYSAKMPEGKALTNA